MTKSIAWKKIKRIFFVGIKGVGVMPLALIAKDAGFVVSGSDIEEEFITDEVLREKRIVVYVGFDRKAVRDFFRNQDANSCLVITTGAHSGYDNPQVLEAKKMGIKYLSQGEALGLFIDGLPFGRKFKGITVTGSHGKTTVTSITASCLVHLGKDPSYSIGTSRIFPIGESGHLGKGDFFVAEGDEYVGEPVYDKTPKILYQHPEYTIINNIDFDHPDIYKNVDDVKKVIMKFMENVKPEGALFINNDDKILRDIIKRPTVKRRIVTYGENKLSNYRLTKVNEGLGKTDFSVSKNGLFYGDFFLGIPGAHNAKNALSVISLLDYIGTDKQDIIASISKFKGSRRRAEKIGKTKNGALVIDDYAHHPAEIRATIHALKKFYNKKIVCVFQSHTYSRTRRLLRDFASSFDSIHELVLLPIFRSQRDTEADILTSEEFFTPFKKKSRNVRAFDSIKKAVEYLEEKKYGDDSMIVTMGAGDVYKVGYDLVADKKLHDNYSLHENLSKRT